MIEVDEETRTPIIIVVVPHAQGADHVTMKGDQKMIENITEETVEIEIITTVIGTEIGTGIAEARTGTENETGIEIEKMKNNQYDKVSHH